MALSLEVMAHVEEYVPISLIERLFSLRRRTHANVEYVTAPYYQTSKVCRRITRSVLSGSVEYYVHMTVAVDHLSPIFSVVLQFH